MIEVGAQPQGLLRQDVYELTEKMALAILDFCLAWNAGENLELLPTCEAYRLGHEVPFPLDENGERLAMIHSNIQDKDFSPVAHGDPIFKAFDGTDYLWQGEQVIYPHFINEAAYQKLDVAFATAEKTTL